MYNTHPHISTQEVSISATNGNELNPHHCYDSTAASDQFQCLMR